MVGVIFGRRSIRERVEAGDLELAERDCPSCSTTLYASTGRLPPTVFYCPADGCRFEGPEAPSSVIVRGIRAFLERRSD